MGMRRYIGLVLFVGSYISLYFGLYGALVHYEEHAELKASWFKGHEDHLLEQGVTELVELLGDKAKIPIVPEVTRALVGDRGWDWSLLHLLLSRAEDGKSGYAAAYFLIFFGMVLPALKFLAVCYWQLSPFPGGSELVTLASRLTRWTAVDAIAEAMLVALLLRAGVFAEHRQGYVCFVGYIFCSAVSIWIMDERGDSKGGSLFSGLVGRCLSCRIPPFLTVITGIAFISLSFFGATYYPLATIYVPRSRIYSSVEYIIKPYKGMLKFIGEEDDVQRLIKEILPHLPVPHGEASVAEAVHTLLFSGHIFTIAGSVMLFSGVIFCPLVESILGIVLAFQASAVNSTIVSSVTREGTDEEMSRLLDEDKVETGPLIKESWTCCLREMAADLAMLDVFVAGMAVAGAILATLGDVLVAELKEGFYCLVRAVLVGWLHNGLCSLIVHNTDTRILSQSKAASEARARARKTEEKVLERKNSQGILGPLCCVKSTPSGKVVEVE